jgi:hypothetical protein
LADAVEKVVTNNKEFAEDTRKVLMQTPFFARGAEGLRLMQAQENLINSVSGK